VALWSDWSDGKKWLMGIMASIVTLVLTTVITRFVIPQIPARSEPSLTRTGKLIIQHLGAKDPKNEGFTSGYALALPTDQKQWGRIRLMPSQNPASWRIENPVVGAVVYRYALSDDDSNQARHNGWRITLRARLLSQTDPEGGIHANLYTGVRRYDLNVKRAYPYEQNRSPELVVRLNTHVAGGKATTGFEKGLLIKDGNGSHNYVMIYDPASGVAKVYVDDEKVLDDPYSGHTDFNRDKPFFTFGTSGAVSTFELAQFEVFS
jgi:hypothetical protein